MASEVNEELPSVGQAIAGVLQRIPRDEQPLLIALAERLAAARYRSWAAEPVYEPRRSALLACAAREEDIATRVEALYPDAAKTQDGILRANPDLEEVNRTLFAGRPLPQQLAIQAQGERLGAATWRSFARHDKDQSHTAVFLACAELEEASAVVLEQILGA
jgi:hypothetical protein